MLQDSTYKMIGIFQVKVGNGPGYAKEVTVSQKIKHGIVMCCSKSLLGIYLKMHKQTIFANSYSYLHILLQRRFIHRNQRLKEQGYQQMDA